MLRKPLTAITMCLLRAPRHRSARSLARIVASHCAVADHQIHRHRATDGRTDRRTDGSEKGPDDRESSVRGREIHHEERTDLERRLNQNVIWNSGVTDGILLRLVLCCSFIETNNGSRREPISDAFSFRIRGRKARYAQCDHRMLHGR